MLGVVITLSLRAPFTLQLPPPFLHAPFYSAVLTRVVFPKNILEDTGVPAIFRLAIRGRALHTCRAKALIEILAMGRLGDQL